MTENFYFNFAYSMNGKKSKYHDMFCRVTVPSGPDTSKVALEKFSRYRKGRGLRYSFHFFKNIYRMMTPVTNRIRCDFGHPSGVILPTV